MCRARTAESCVMASRWDSNPQPPCPYWTAAPESLRTLAMRSLYLVELPPAINDILAWNVVRSEVARHFPTDADFPLRRECANFWRSLELALTCRTDRREESVNRLASRSRRMWTGRCGL